MLVLHDARCAGYGSPAHPEKAVRVVNTAAHLRESFPGWAWKSDLGAVPDETLLLAHTPAHLARLEEPGDFDADTANYPGIAKHARRSVAAALWEPRAMALGEPRARCSPSCGPRDTTRPRTR